MSHPCSTASCASEAFTLLELLLVVAIIGVLAALAVPQFQRFVDRAHSVNCAGNLKAIGVAVRSYVTENDGTYPVIETNPDDPIYPKHVEARGMLESLEAYGVTERTLRCGADLAGPNYFASRGTSYQWHPLVDGEISIRPTIYTRRGERQIDPSLIRLCTDMAPVHNGRRNALFGDGGVRHY